MGQEVEWIWVVLIMDDAMDDTSITWGLGQDKDVCLDKTSSSEKEVF